MRGVLFRFFLGGIGGFIGWAVIEPTAPSLDNQIAWGAFETFLTLTVGGLVGLLLCGWNSYQQGSRTFYRQALLGAILGGVGAVIGKTLGGVVATLIGGPRFYESFGPTLVIARSFIGLGVGAMLGLGIGIPTGNVVRTLRSLTGGAIGGVLGGFMFDTLGRTFAMVFPVVVVGGGTESGQFSRGLLFTLIGAFVGLFIGAVEEFAKTAWIRLRLGRNEGREWTLDKQTTVIGKDERADIPLYGDPGVIGNHATIVRQGDQYWLFDAGSPGGTFINGTRVQQAPLIPGSVIQIGGFQLQFLVKKGSTVGKAAEQLRGQQSYPISNSVSPVAPVHNQAVRATQMTNQGQVMTPTVAIPTQTSMGQLTLVVLSGQSLGQRFPVSGTLEIGRETSGISLPTDSNASRRHASISTTPLGGFVRDLGSTNGTFVNGVRVMESAVSRGDIIKIGATEFRVE